MLFFWAMWLLGIIMVSGMFIGFGYFGNKEQWGFLRIPFLMVAVGPVK
ncbi:MAG: hypothetical protein AAFX53_08480 [Bacteroidota bacterium]